jgi:hypothetical protein
MEKLVLLELVQRIIKDVSNVGLRPYKKEEIKLN